MMMMEIPPAVAVTAAVPAAWKPLTMPFRCSIAQSLEPALRSLGAGGWRLVSSHTSSRRVVVIFFLIEKQCRKEKRQCEEREPSILRQLHNNTKTKNKTTKTTKTPEPTESFSLNISIFAVLSVEYSASIDTVGEHID